MFQSGDSGEGKVLAWDTVVLCLTCEMSNAGGREGGERRAEMAKVLFILIMKINVPPCTR